jgi:sarcosine oxidase, subunit gamma
MHDNWMRHAGSVAVSRQPGGYHAMLRLNSPRPSLIARIEVVLGLPLPKEPNKAVGAVPRIWWTSPNCWLIGGLGSLVALEAAIAEETAHITEVGDGRIIFRLAGSGARDLLAHGTGLDLHPRVFPNGCCAQTLFADVPVLIDRMPEMDSFDIHADAGFADYLGLWFETAIQSFGGAGE